jgi:hypothetical protein
MNGRPQNNSSPPRLDSGDLHVIDVVKSPDGLEAGVGETEHQHVPDPFFAEVVIDTVSVCFIDHPEALAVQCPCGGFIVPEWLLQDHAAPTGITAEQRCHGQLLEERIASEQAPEAPPI